MKADGTFQLNMEFFKRLKKAQELVLEKTADQLYSDLVLGQTMPFETGNLQNEATVVEVSGEEVRIVSSTPYARRLYFHPEYNFRKDKNPNAGGRWFDPYLPGHEKGKLIPTIYAELLKKEMGL